MRTAVVTMICIMSLCASAFADDFRGIDINKDGRIDLQEFQGFVKEIGPSKIRQFDADADGFLSEKEFAGDGNFKKETPIGTERSTHRRAHNFWSPS